MKKHDCKKSFPVWRMKTQECKGKYFFDGQMFMTRGVHDRLSVGEVTQIITRVKNEVKKHNGADYLFVFTCKSKKIFVIDNLNEEMKKGSIDVFVAEHNYFTIMFSEEY